MSALTRSVFALSGSGSGQGGGGGVGGYSVERRWRREERRRSGEFTPTCYQFVPPPWPSKRSGESETESVCMSERGRGPHWTSAHIFINMTKTGPVASMDYSHMWLPGMCPEHLCGCQVGLSEFYLWIQSSDQEGQHVETERKCYAKSEIPKSIYMSWISECVFSRNRGVYVYVLLCEWIQMHYLWLFYFKALKLKIIL